jgi:hypothetical protein
MLSHFRVCEYAKKGKMYCAAFLCWWFSIPFVWETYLQQKTGNMVLRKGTEYWGREGGKGQSSSQLFHCGTELDLFLHLESESYCLRNEHRKTLERGSWGLGLGENKSDAFLCQIIYCLPCTQSAQVEDLVPAFRDLRLKGRGDSTQIGPDIRVSAVLGSLQRRLCSLPVQLLRAVSIPHLVTAHAHHSLVFT